MLKTKINHLFTLTFIAALLVTSCGGESVDPQAAIQTSVAETVTAQPPIIITNTPEPTLFPTQTPFATPVTGVAFNTPTTAPPSNSSNLQCAQASLQDETIVDGTVVKAGEQFTKTWYITNTSNCVWDTTYKIVFWAGDPLGGGYVYNLPQATGPGQTVPISLVLTAPTADGTYRSEWKLQTPDNLNFGVGQYQTAFYTEVVVNSNPKLEYDITSASLVITRDPLTGCQPANMVYTAHVTIVTNGPLEFQYQIRQQDNNNDYKKWIEVKSATEYTDNDHTWKLGRAATQNSNRWMQLVILEPFYREYPKVGFEFYCP